MHIAVKQCLSGCHRAGFYGGFLWASYLDALGCEASGVLAGGFGDERVRLEELRV